MKKYYAVIDTNVIVSSLLRKDSIPGRIVDLTLLGRIVPLLNEEIIAEYKDVLMRNKFGFEAGEVNDLLFSIREKGIFLQRKQAEDSFPDEEDIVFYEICLSGRSTMESYLITGNLRHYPIRNYVVTPRRMLEIIEEDPGL
ncbi:MAG: putative toxin-antitoxin system toxin component, PIN family [Erysipelotrichaceae bacterium]|nr:putative toxin-antitoxin system toxin component, PIN family [Erysipelotrichaceae bacterium]